MYVKNFNFLFEWMFLRKMVELKKLENHLQQLPQKNKPTLLIRLPTEFQEFLIPHLFFLIRPPSNFQRAKTKKTKHNTIPRLFLHILV